MSRGNDVFQVLIPTGNQAILAKDLAIENLAVGQLGVFSYKDNISLDSTSADLLTRGKNFYLAVGVDTTGGATLNELRKSAGTHIQLRNAISYTGRCYTPAQPKVVEMTGFSAKCDTEYGVKFELRNQQAYRTNGYNQVMKSFVTKTDNCEGCEDCPSGDCISLVKNLVTDINKDEDALILAEYISSEGDITITVEPTTDEDLTITLGSETGIIVPILNLDTGAQVAAKIAAAINAVSGSLYSASSALTVVTVYGPAGTVVYAPGTTGSTATTNNVAVALVADPDVYAAANAGGCLGMRFTMQSDTIKSYCDINLNYFSPRATDVIVTKIAGFENSGSIAITQDIVYQEGSGYDIKQLEYEAGGWNGKPGPYRVSELTGTARGGFDYAAVVTEKYNVFHLGYDQASIAGFMEHKNPLRTIVAIPTADSTARDAVVVVLDALLANTFEPLAAYAAACPTDGTTVNLSTTGGNNFGDSIGTV